MYRAFWNFIGLASGWLGGKRLRGDVDYKPSRDGVRGVAGTFIGGVFVCVSGISGAAKTVPTTGVAMICAALLTALVSAGDGRRAIAHNS